MLDALNKIKTKGEFWTGEFWTGEFYDMAENVLKQVEK